MKKFFFLAPTGRNVGLTSICVGLVRAFDQVGKRVAFCKPITQSSSRDNVADIPNTFVDTLFSDTLEKGITLPQARDALINGQVEDLMEEVVKYSHQIADDADIVVVEGLVPQSNMAFIPRINAEMAATLDADVILVAAKNNLTFSELDQQISLNKKYFDHSASSNLIGCIFNKIGAPSVEQKSLMTINEAPNDFSIPDETFKEFDTLSVFSAPGFHCLGKVPWNPVLMAPRVSDIAEHLPAEWVENQAERNRRVSSVVICARRVGNMIDALKAGVLVITSGDREDIFLAVCMAALKGIPLAGVLFTGGYVPDKRLMALCEPAINAGIPVLKTELDTIVTTRNLDNLDGDIPPDDLPRIEQVMSGVAESIDIDWLVQRTQVDRPSRLSPAAFRYRLVQQARSLNKRIVLPEGEEPRTIEAAITCHEKGIARCVLLGDEKIILSTAESLALAIPSDLEIINPSAVMANYIEPFVEMRKHKGVTEPMAAAMLEDTVVMGTVMLAQNEVDGLVSGAIHTTANTIRPALQLIKAAPESKLVSSVFFMCLPEQVLVYGDCAVNPNPSSEELANIAIQSGDSAAAMGIEPRIAMISYSTGESGMGQDVDKVREATKIAREKRPDLLIDGPLQYDAASVSAVAKAKAPDSQVAGNATVFVFPDLNTGNTTYKAVQRSANVVSIGPMLQGLRKPVNDLSRGALVEDIVYTIALTAIQAG